MLNFIAIHGRLTADPELKQTQSGVSVCNFTVAVDRFYSKMDEKQTDFFKVVCWRGLADMVSKYFSKGKEIVVSGEMQSKKWQDKDGNDRISWEILANNVDFCGSKNVDYSKSESANKPESCKTGEFTEVVSDEELPF